MGAVHVRTPKNFVLEERLERYANAIETNPESYAGNWREACAPAGGAPFTRLHLDLGCGKGTYLVEQARREPNTLFIGMDQEHLHRLCRTENLRAGAVQRTRPAPRCRIAAAAICRRRARCHHHQLSHAAAQGQVRQKATRPCRPPNAVPSALFSRCHRHTANRQ